MYSTNEYHRHHALLFPLRQSILRYIRQRRHYQTGALEPLEPGAQILVFLHQFGEQGVIIRSGFLGLVQLVFQALHFHAEISILAQKGGVFIRKAQAAGGELLGQNR